MRLKKGQQINKPNCKMIKKIRNKVDIRQQE